MKRYLCVGMVFVFVLSTCLAEQIPIKELVKVKDFSIGNEKGALQVGPNGPISVPSGPFFAKGFREISIFDILNSRINLYDENIEIIKQIPLMIDFDITPYQVSDNNNVLLLATNIQGFGLYNQENKRIIGLWLNEYPEFIDYRSFAYYDDVLFVTDKDLRMWSVPEPLVNPENNREKLLNQEETMSYLTKRWGLNGRVRVDGLGRLFIDEELVTRDFPTWIGYKGVKTDSDRFYVGVDAFGNTYWSSQTLIYVYPRNSKKSNYFRFDSQNVSGYPTVDYQTGDLFFLGRPQGDSIPLYKIARDW